MSQYNSNRSNPTDVPFWTTTDLGLVAYLRYRGCDRYDFQPTSATSHLQEAVFPRTPTLDAALEEWRSGQADHFKAYSAAQNEAFRRLRGAGGGGR